MKDFMLPLTFNVCIWKNIMWNTPGVDPGFPWGGGGGAQKIMRAHAHHEHEAPSPLWLGLKKL